MMNKNRQVHALWLPNIYASLVNHYIMRPV